MHALDTLAKELELSPERVEEEGLKALLETRIHGLAAQLGTICRKYGVGTYDDFDHLIQDGKVNETQALDDFQTADHLEAKLRRLKKILLDQVAFESDSILVEMVRRLVEKFHPISIYLFGSRARGEQTQDSDYDLLVVLPDSLLPRYQRERAAFLTLCGVGASKDVLVLTEREFESKKSVVCSLPAMVDREGALLYAA